MWTQHESVRAGTCVQSPDVGERPFEISQQAGTGVALVIHTEMLLGVVVCTQP